MNRERAAELLPVIQAFAEGKTVEFDSSGRGEWVHKEVYGFTFPVQRYRIKPAPKLRPWTADTFPKDRLVWVRARHCGPCANSHLIVRIGDHHVRAQGHRAVTWECLLDDFVQTDGSPCGVLEE